MAEFVLWGVPGSPYFRAPLIALEEKRADYRLGVVAPGEAKTPAHLARHPFGRIPALDHGDFRLYETQAILRYLDAILPGPSLRPIDPKALARMDQIVGIIDWYVFPFITVGISAERFFAQMFWGRDASEENIAKSLPNAGVCVRELERLKGSSTYLTGETVTIADLMLAAHFDYFAETPEGKDLLEDTSLTDWLALMRSRPSFVATATERLMAAA